MSARHGCAGGTSTQYHSRFGELFYIMALDMELFTDQNGFVNELINQSRILPGGASS